MSINTKLATKLIKKYSEEDEDVVKKLKCSDRNITFLYDMIDLDISIEINDSGNNEFEITKGKEKRKIKNRTSFKSVLKTLMDGLKQERDKKIEYYASMETPIGETPFSPSCETPFSPDTGNIAFDDGEELETPVDPSGTLDSLIVQDVVLRESSFEILTSRKLIEMQMEAVKKISETMFVSESGAKIILRAYRWDEERILNTFLKSGKEKVLQDVGLSTTIKFEEVSSNKNRNIIKPPEDEFECPSCFDDVLYTQTLQLDACGHRFCNDCWKQHLTIKIKDGLSKRITCMGSGCVCVLDEMLVSKYITDPETKRKYDTKILESFVEDNDSMKWCQSAPHCGNAVLLKVSPKTPLEVHCRCSKIFCFLCLDEAHNPCSCRMLSEWRKKCADDSETLNWIKSNTRDCPRCHKATEKNGGCNHISCTCGSHWCWACGGDFDSNTVYSHKCNQYLEKGGEGEGRGSLERYLHYYNHYNAHYTSFKNQKRMEREMEHKISRLHNNSDDDMSYQDTWVQMDFLRRGLEVLFDTRRALMHSYVFAFYLFQKGIDRSKPNKLLEGCKKFEDERQRVRAKNLFEDTQEQLETTTEGLNKYLDLPLEKILEETTKKEVIKMSVLNEKRIHGLFDVIREEMILEGDYKLPDPRFIVTHPSYRNSSSLGEMKDSQDKVFKKPKIAYNSSLVAPKSDDPELQRAIQASLMDEEAQLQQAIRQSQMQEAIRRSLQEK